jgi:phosphoenolpyruvate---glycerone phosphotransferase subunit DhaL
MKRRPGGDPATPFVAARWRGTYTRPTVSAPATVNDVLDPVAVRAGLARCRVVVERHAAWLTRLDAVLGDGDHGDNLVIGFRAVDHMLREIPEGTPPGVLLRAVGHRLVAAVGGASGPLYGTAFLEAGERADDAMTLDGATLAAMLMAAAEGLARRGRSAVGDKTILDTLAPAAAAYSQAVAQGASLRTATGLAVRAGARGARSTRAMVARRGLALRLGERSAGHLDPGAVSCLLLLRALGGR